MTTNKNKLISAVTSVKLRDNSKWTLFGDSITAQNNFSDASHNSANSRGFFTWANIYSGGTESVVNNAGVGGEKTSDMLARIQDDVLMRSSGIVFVLAGINDIFAGVSEDIITANLNAIYKKILAQGKNLHIATITSSTAINTTAKKETLHAVNQWIRAFARDNKHVMFTDFHGVLLNPADANGYPYTTYMYDSQTHPNTSGGQALGKAVYQTWVDYGRLSRNKVYASLTDVLSATHLFGNPVTNPIMQGTGGGNIASGASGSVAASWNNMVTGTTVSAVASKVARTDLPGYEWQQIVHTFTTSGANYFFQSSGDLSSIVNVGDTYRALIEMEMSNLAFITGIEVGIECDDLAGNLISQNYGFHDSQSNVAFGAAGGVKDFSGVIATPEFKIPAGFKKFKPQVVVYGGAGGTATIRVGRIDLRKVY